MFFKFDNYTGRITPSNYRLVCNPEGIQAKAAETEKLILQSSTVKFPSDADKSMPDNKHARIINDKTKLSKHKLGIVPNTPGYKKVMELQTLMTKNNGLLVWQKLGAKDRLAYYGIFGLCALGVAYSIRNLYLLSFPKPPSQ